MDFRFDDDQVALRDAVGAFCERELDLAKVATREFQRAADALWNGLADMGVFGLLIPDAGGALGAVEAAIVFEQLGAHLATGPVLWSTIAAPFVPDAATGAIRVAGIQATAAGPFVIEHAAESDVVVILYDDRIETCAAADLPAPRADAPFDPLTPTCAFDALRAGAVVAGPDDARRLRLAGTVLASAMLVGVAQGAFDVAAGYALERQQFGVPIGSFQAIKHLLADAYVRTELARSTTYAAAALFDDERADERGRSKAGDVEVASRTAKLLAGEAGVANGRTAVQVLGGMGFTWEMLPHYFLKRSWVLDQMFGTGDAHALALSETLESGTTRWT